MYIVIGHVRSRTLRVLWLLQEMGLDYELRDASPRSDAVRMLYPAGKIPVLLDGDDVFTDSTAILTYLADKHGKLSFGAGTPERAVQDGHTHFLLDEFDACLWMAARHSFVLPEGRRMPAIKDSLKWEFARSQKRFVERLADGPFLMGETLTIADIIAAHCGRWAGNAGFEIGERAFGDYIDRLVARPAFQRALGDT